MKRLLFTTTAVLALLLTSCTKDENKIQGRWALVFTITDNVTTSVPAGQLYLIFDEFTVTTDDGSTGLDVDSYTLEDDNIILGSGTILPYEFLGNDELNISLEPTDIWIFERQ